MQADTSPTVNAPRFALVTGAAKRLGREIALELARAGWSIVLHYRSSGEQARSTADEIRALGVACETFQADLASSTEVDALAHFAASQGDWACLVNNASLFEFDDSANFDPALFDVHMASNLRAPLRLIQALYQATGEGQQAVAVNLLDQKLFNLNPDFLSYTLSKSALHTATTLAAMALAPRLRVVGVAPGLTMISHLQTEAQFKATHQISPLGRSSEPVDIARTVRFAVESKAITGSTIVVDGGQHLVPMARDFSMVQS